MGKPRTGKNRYLPEHVYCTKGKYIFKKYLGTKGGKSLFEKEIVIGPDTMPVSQVHLLVEALTSNAEYTVAWMVDEYEKSEEFGQLSREWQKTCTYMIAKIKRSDVKYGGKFGDVNITLITPAVIKRYLSSLSSNGARTNAKKVLSAAWSWARQYYDSVPVNPCREVRMKKAPPRDRYVTTEEYLNVYTIAPDFWKALMEFCLICRARRIEIVRLKRSQIFEKGVHLKRAKGSLDEITLWTPRLQAAYELIKSIRGDVESEYLFCDPGGGQMKKNTLDSQWNRIISQAVEEELVQDRFHFHDLKAKGVSDHEEQISGHTTEDMKLVYVRNTQEVKGTV